MGERRWGGQFRCAVAAVAVVVQSDQDPAVMVVTLADGAEFSVTDDASQPEATNAQAESLLAACP